MRVWKPLFAGLLAWGFWSSVCRADPITWPNGPWSNWSSWTAGGYGAPAAAASPIVYWNQSAASQPTRTAAAAISPAAVAPAPVRPAPVMPAPVAPAPAALPPMQPMTATSPAISWPSASYVAAPASPPVPASVAVSAPTYSAPAVAPRITSFAPVLTFHQTAASIAPVSVPSVATLSNKPVDAFINLGSGPYPQAGLITTGGAQPWSNSTGVANLFGGPPTLQQQQSFDAAILQRVQQTFAQSGIPITLTSDPAVTALHTLSVVSNTASSSLPTAIGMTQVGVNGFSFIDQSVQSAQNVNQLESIVAHNVSHELMLAFGVPENYDQTGAYVDARNANWSMMVSPTATFSPAASLAITQAIQSQQNAAGGLGAQLVGPTANAVPEPATWISWLAALTAALGWARRRAAK